MTTVTWQVEKAEEDLYQSAGDDAFVPGTARVYYLNADGTTEFLCENTDIYDLLSDDETVETLGSFTNTNYIVVTAGWAAPRDTAIAEEDEVKPSKHPQKRRVRMTLACCEAKTVATLRFQDDKETVIVDDSGEGSLADAIAKLNAQIQDHKQTQKAGK